MWSLGINFNQPETEKVAQSETVSNPASGLAIAQDEKESVLPGLQNDVTHSVYGDASKIRMKPPQFDRKTPWQNYLCQFEAAAKANAWTLKEQATALTLALRGDATDILQTLGPTEREDYEQLTKHLQMRYGQTNLEHVYHFGSPCQADGCSRQSFKIRGGKTECQEPD